MSIPQWWWDRDIVDSSGTHRGRCSEVAGSSPFSGKKLWASLELSGATQQCQCTPGMGAKITCFVPTERTSFLSPKRDKQDSEYYLHVSICELESDEWKLLLVSLVICSCKQLITKKRRCS